MKSCVIKVLQQLGQKDLKDCYGHLHQLEGQYIVLENEIEKFIIKINSNTSRDDEQETEETETANEGGETT